MAQKLDWGETAAFVERASEARGVQGDAAVGDAVVVVDGYEEGGR